jgi:hypothetical protein
VKAVDSEFADPNLDVVAGLIEDESPYPEVRSAGNGLFYMYVLF